MIVEVSSTVSGTSVNTVTVLVSTVSLTVVVTSV